jgi:hypothetical protein
MDEAKPVFHPTIGREAKTATFLSRCLLSFGLRVAGFCPRQLNRCAASLDTYIKFLLNF